MDPSVRLRSVEPRSDALMPFVKAREFAPTRQRSLPRFDANHDCQPRRFASGNPKQLRFAGDELKCHYPEM